MNLAFKKNNKFSRSNISIFLQLSALSCYLFALNYYFEANRILWHLFAILALACLLDGALKKFFTGTFTISASTLILSFALFLLVGTRYNFAPYFFATCAGVTSKYFIKYNQTHVFNPANFALIFAFCIFPESVRLPMSQWQTTTGWLIPFWILGAITSYVAGRAVLSWTYMLVIIALNGLRAWSGPMYFSYLLGPHIDIAGVIFTYHMLTDPKTTPSSLKQQGLLGLSIAILDFVFQVFEFLPGTFVAAALCAAIRPVISERSAIFGIFQRKLKIVSAST